MTGKRIPRMSCAEFRPGRGPVAAGTPEDASGRRAPRSRSRGACGAGVRPIDGGCCEARRRRAGGVDSAASARRHASAFARSRRGRLASRARFALALRGLRLLGATASRADGFARAPRSRCAARFARLARAVGCGAAGASRRLRSRLRRRVARSARGMLWPISFSIAAIDLLSSGATMRDRGAGAAGAAGAADAMDVVVGDDAARRN